MPIHSRLKKMFLVAVSLVAVGALIVGARTRVVRGVFAKTDARAQGPAPSNLNQQAAQTQTERIEAELITVRPTGFDPAEIRRGPGPFFLVIENRSGTDLGRLRLEATESGLPVPVSRIPDAQIDRERHNYGERIDLPPGHYRIRQTAGQGWSFTITISAR